MRRRQDQWSHDVLRTRLNNGDQVRIVTSKAQTPSPTWERFVVTGKAKARIRRFIRLREKEQYVELGRRFSTKRFRTRDTNILKSP